VIDGVADQFSADSLAGFLVDFSRGGFVYIDTVHRAGLGAHVAGDALVHLKLMNPPIARRKRKPLLWILHGHRLLKAVFQRDFHADRDRPDVVVDVFEIVADAHVFTQSPVYSPHYGGLRRPSPSDHEGPT